MILSCDVTCVNPHRRQVARAAVIENGKSSLVEDNQPNEEPAV